MRPFFKYTGGKQKEIKNIKQYFPDETKRIVEPFCGAAAVSFHFELPALLGDTNEDLINLYHCVQDFNCFEKLINKIKTANIDDKKTERNNEHLRDLYYYYRDEMFKTSDKLEKAFRYLFLRQLCFSGMTRVNSKTGKSNVPYGWYGFFKTRLDLSYYNLLKNWEIKQQSFDKTLDDVKDGDWIFLDPPYYERNSKYEVDSTAGDSEKLHIDIFNKIKNINQPWLFVHSDCDLYRDLYKDFNIYTNDYAYAQNFKGKSIKNGKVKHLYITNY